MSDVGPAKDPARHGLGGVLRGFGLLAVSNLLGQTLGFAALVIVTRRIGVDALGNYTFALTLATYFGLLANLGVRLVATREIAVDGRRLRAVFSESLTLQAGTAGVSYVVLVSLSGLMSPNHQSATLIPIVALTFVATGLTLDWVLLPLGASGAVAVSRLLGQVAYAALVPFLVTQNSGPAPYAWLNVLGLAVTALLIAGVVLRRGLFQLDLPRWHRLIERLRRSVTVGYSLGMIQIYNVIDVVMLGYLSTSTQVGVYAAASRLPYSIVTFANLWVQVFFPHAASRLQDDPRAFRADISRVLSAAVIVATFLVAGAVASASRLMPAMFGGAFAAAATPFALLGVAMSLVLIEAVLSNVLLAAARDRDYARIVTAAAGFNVAINLVLIPTFAASGAAVATILTEGLLVGLTLRAVIPAFGVPALDWSRVLRGCVGGGLLALTLLAAPGSVWVGIGLGLVVLAGSTVILRPFDAALWRLR
jgi:O-antigen/teichoic acid export membrane protein